MGFNSGFKGLNKLLMKLVWLLNYLYFVLHELLCLRSCIHGRRLVVRNLWTNFDEFWYWLLAVLPMKLKLNFLRNLQIRLIVH